MTITIASGKGGTGKTLIATNLAASLSEKSVQLLDCDVEAPNSHIFLQPKLVESEPVHISVPQVDDTRCTLCGRCAEVCEYHAIGLFGKSVLVFPELCHACGGCLIACAENALTEIPHQVGELQRGMTGQIAVVSGVLAVGQAKATPVIAAVKKRIVANAINIVDAPPGTSCPVVEAVKGSDFVLLVTEPTPFGLHDLQLAAEVMDKLRLLFGVIINRAGIGNDGVERFCREKQTDVLLRIPYQREIAQTYSSGRLLIEAMPHYRPVFQQLYRTIEARL